MVRSCPALPTRALPSWHSSLSRCLGALLCRPVDPGIYHCPPPRPPPLPVFIYYRGQNDAWVGYGTLARRAGAGWGVHARGLAGRRADTPGCALLYCTVSRGRGHIPHTHLLPTCPPTYGRDTCYSAGGATVYTRERSLPEQYIPELRAAAEAAGLDWDKFVVTDNSCPPKPPPASLAQRLEKGAERLERSAEQEALLVANDVRSGKLAGGPGWVEEVKKGAERPEHSVEAEAEALLVASEVPVPHLGGCDLACGGG